MDMAQIGVRTRARTLVAAENSGPVKRRKVGGEETEFCSSLVQFNRRRQVTEKSVSAGCVTEPDVSTPALASLQESRGIENLTYNLECSIFNFDVSVDNSKFKTQRETTEEMESTATGSIANSRRQSMAEKMPSETELEEFFDAAETDLEKKIADKYNFDIAKDKPLEGRYEWEEEEEDIQF